MRALLNPVRPRAWGRRNLQLRFDSEPVQFAPQLHLCPDRESAQVGWLQVTETEESPSGPGMGPKERVKGLDAAKSTEINGLRLSQLYIVSFQTK